MSGLRSTLHLFAAAGLLMAAGAIGGHLGLFFDSGSYTRIGEYLAGRLHLAGPIAPFAKMTLAAPMRDNAAIGGWLSAIDSRSPSYGLFLYLGSKLGTFRLVAFLQALCAAWIIRLAARTVLPERPDVGFWAVICVVAAGSSLPFFVDFAMPDVFAGEAILAVALLLGAPSRLSRGETILLLLMIAAAASFHRSHQVIVGVLAVGGTVALILMRRPPRALLLRSAAICALLLVSVGSGLAFKELLGTDLGRATGSPPFLMARLLADGPGQAYLDRACPGGAAPTLCRFADRAMDNSDQILWDPDPQDGIFSASDIATRMKLEAEQGPFVVAVVRADPLGVIGAALRNFATQLVLVVVDDPLGDPGRFKAHEDADLASTDLMMPGVTACPTYLTCPISPLKTPLAVLHVFVLLGSLATLGWVGKSIFDAHGGDEPGKADRIRQICSIALLIGIGILLNAAVCGILSGPFPRYQARIIWLLPMSAVLGTLFVRHLVRRARPAAESGCDDMIEARLEPA